MKHSGIVHDIMWIGYKGSYMFGHDSYPNTNTRQKH